MKEKKTPAVRGVTGYLTLEKKESVIQCDPMGSYTGRANDPFEKPVQDADDL